MFHRVLVLGLGFPLQFAVFLCTGTEAGGAGRSKPRPRALRGRQVAQLPSAARSSPGGTLPHVHQATGGNKPTGLGSAGGKGQRNEQSKAKSEAQFQVTRRLPLLVFVLFSCFGFWFLQEVGSARQRQAGHAGQSSVSSRQQEQATARGPRTCFCCISPRTGSIQHVCFVN